MLGEADLAQQFGIRASISDAGNGRSCPIASLRLRRTEWRGLSVGIRILEHHLDGCGGWRRGSTAVMAENPTHRAADLDPAAGRVSSPTTSGRASSCRTLIRPRGRPLARLYLDRHSFQRLDRAAVAAGEGLYQVRRADDRLDLAVRRSGRSDAASALPRKACISVAISVRRMQAVSRPGPSSARTGAAARHVSFAQSQRSEKTQRPATSSAPGTFPRMAISLGTRLSAGGSDSRRPKVYG